MDWELRIQIFWSHGGTILAPNICQVADLESEKDANGFSVKEFMPFVDQGIPISLALRASRAPDLDRGGEQRVVL